MEQVLVASHIGRHYFEIRGTFQGGWNTPVIKLPLSKEVLSGLIYLPVSTAEMSARGTQGKDLAQN